MPVYTQYTWSDLRSLLADSYADVPFWTPDEALLAFNEGLSVWNLLTGMWQQRELQASVPGAIRYTVSTSLLQHTRITYNNLPLSPTSRYDLTHARPQWRTDTSVTGGGVPTHPMLWAPISLRSFYIWPADGNMAGGLITLDGIAATPVLVEDADTLDLGREHVRILLGYALHVLTLTKGGPFFQATAPLFQAFLAAAVEQNGQLKTSVAFRRFMGLDDRGFKPLRGEATRLDSLVQS